MSRMIGFLVAVLLPALAVAGCGSKGGNTIISYAVSGTVTSSGSGLQGVIVKLSSSSTGTRTYTTNATGHFAFAGVLPGTYVITPTRAGYTFSPSTLTVEMSGANVTGQDFAVTSNTALSCTYGHGQVPDGIQFYNYDGIAANDGSATADATSHASLTWQAQFQNVTNLYQPGSYSGSLRVRLWAVPYPVSSLVFSDAHVIADFYPHFTGPGAASSTQLYAGAVSAVQNSSATAYNPPAGEYCIVATLEQYSANCPSADHYCDYDWWQSGNAWRFY